MPALEVLFNNVSKKMADAQALKNISAVIKSGQINGIIGPNGAGKTTFIRLAAMLLSCVGGSISYFENGIKKEQKQVKADTGYFPQEPSLYADLSCLENMEFFRDLYGLTHKEFKNRSSELFRLIGTVISGFLRFRVKIRFFPRTTTVFAPRTTNPIRIFRQRRLQEV